MKYLKTYEARNPHTPELLFGISPEFWEMVRKAQWWLAIKKCNNLSIINGEYNEEKDKAAGRIYINYTFEEVQKFNEEFDILYRRLYEYFEPYSNTYGVGDDGYWDLLSSIIGKGKIWVMKCIRNPKKLPKKLVDDDNYLENFQYLLSVNRKEYSRIKAWYSEILFHVKLNKYNL